MKTIGIMGAMPEEIEAIIPFLQKKEERSIGGRTYHAGEFNGHKLVLVFSRWGKVAAASTATTLLHEFGITELLFTGVAGAVNTELRTGDLVVAEKLIQHDMDARPLMDLHEIPLLGKTWFETDLYWRNRLIEAGRHILRAGALGKLIPEEKLRLFHIHEPVLHMGAIASGDQFVSSSLQKNSIKTLLPEVLCLEMEGAAVAQVCFEHQIPFALIRTISDSADESAVVDFPLFIKHIASLYSLAIVETLFGPQP